MKSFYEPPTLHHPKCKVDMSLPSDLEGIRYEFSALEAPGKPSSVRLVRNEGSVLQILYIIEMVQRIV